MLHWIENTPSSKLNATDEKAYFYMKVIKNPKPMKIITCTSWNIGYYSSTVASDLAFAAAFP